MGQVYSNPKRANDPHALPDVETWCADAVEVCCEAAGCGGSVYTIPAPDDWADLACPSCGEKITTGATVVQHDAWFWWSCFPGCMPDGEPMGRQSTTRRKGRATMPNHYESTTPFDAFTRGYLECLLWTNDPTPGSGEWDRFDETFPLLDASDIKRAVDDCAAFQRDHAALLAQAGDASQNGHDFYLTRCGHGAGFWDRGYGDVGRQLTDAAHVYGNVDTFLSGPCVHCGAVVYSGAGNGEQWGTDESGTTCAANDDGAHNPVGE